MKSYSLHHCGTPEVIDMVLVNGAPNPGCPDLPYRGAGETSHKPHPLYNTGNSGILATITSCRARLMP